MDKPVELTSSKTFCGFTSVDDFSKVLKSHHALFSF